MGKILIAGAIVVGAVVLAKRRAMSQGFDFEKFVERMPDNAPPKVLFRNLTTIRENTERILEHLERETSPASET